MENPSPTPALHSDKAPQTSALQRRIAISLLLVGALCTGMGQTIVFSVLPPLAREMGMENSWVLAIFMISAMFWVFLGPRWGRRSDMNGRKAYIFIGLFGFGISMVLFGGAVSLGLSGALSGVLLFAAMVASRALYGIIGSAGPPAAQAYIADRTSTADRTAGISGFSAAFGLGAMLGPSFGAVTAFISPIAPFFAIAGVALIMSAAILLFLPERTGPKKRTPSAKVSLRDKRIVSFLLFGLVFGVINAIPIQTIGFYFMDALGFSTSRATQYVSIALTGGAMAALFSQLIIVQRFRVEPRTLMRVAPLLLVSGHTLIWAAPSLWPVTFGMVLSGLGAGLAVPGFNAAASLSVTKQEQGSSIGLAGSAGAAGFIVAPPLAIGLYALAPQAPYIFTTILAVGLLAFALRSRSIRALSTTAEPLPQTGRPASSPYHR